MPTPTHVVVLPALPSRVTWLVVGNWWQDPRLCLHGRSESRRLGLRYAWYGEKPSVSHIPQKTDGLQDSMYVVTVPSTVTEHSQLPAVRFEPTLSRIQSWHTNDTSPSPSPFGLIRSVSIDFLGLYLNPGGLSWWNRQVRPSPSRWGQTFLTASSCSPRGATRN